ncbi:MAG: hypothetical protein H0X30_00270 [Anaerolineae bacterium]|nr:hypothetical protein [Anaerolineae bacterium]
MPNLFQVTERDITRLTNHELRPILNKLLLAEARRYGIPTASVEITSEDNVGDDGIDAQINHTVNVPVDCRIPTGLSVWQYKAGETTPAAIRSESQKPGIQAAILNDGSYCFVVGHSYTVPKRRSREAALDQAFTQADKPPKRRLFTAAEIAEWVSDYPVVARPLLGLEVPDEFSTFDKWDSLRQSGTNIAFQANGSRKNVINGIVDILGSRPETTSIRLIGADGSGKTRLILEAIREANAADLTFYASTPAAVPNNFFSFIESRTSIHRLVLIVDECSEDDFRTLLRTSQGCDGRVILIAIGSGELRDAIVSEANAVIFPLDNLDNTAIRRVIQLAASSLHSELQDYIARTVGGSVKLAVALAESISLNQNADTISALMRLDNIQFILTSLCRTQDERDAMRALSLLRFIGLDDEVANEGRVVAEFLDLDFGKLKRTAIQMQRRGLVIKQGRYRYVTPALLAIWFAGEVWEAQGSDIISTLLPQLPSPSARFRILKRLGDIGEEELAVPITEQLFGRNGALANVEALDNADNANLFNILANASPVACINALERIFRTVSRERLLEFNKGRRNVVYALQGLLRRTETFYQAARILLKLADAENETWGNNATGIWREVFYTRLGLSPFPASERHSLIQEALLPVNSLETRLLGVKAIHAALSPFESSAFGDGPGGHLSERWQPELWDDIWQSYRSALTLLDQVLRDSDERVEQEAISTFIGVSRHLLRTPLKSDILKRMEGLLDHPRLTLQKKQFIDVLSHATEYEANVLTQEEIATIQQWREVLLGTSYHNRLHRWVGQLNSYDQRQVYRDKETPVDLNALTTDLAQEGYNQPELLRPELEWLTSSEAQYAGKFALELGHVDSQTHWLNELIAFLPHAAQCISYYLYGKWSAGNQEIVDTLLDEWVETQPELALSAFLTIQRLGGIDRQGQRVTRLVEKGWLPLEYLAWLCNRGWLKPLSDTVFTELLHLLTNKDEPQYTNIALDLISEWLQSHPQHNPKTAQLIVSFLDRIPSQMGWYHWREICLFYLQSFTGEIVKAATRLMGYWEAIPDSPEDDRLFILREALQIAPDLAWSIISEALLQAEAKDNDWFSIHLDVSGDDTLDVGTLLESIQLPILLEWVEANKPLAAQIVARYIQTERTPLPTIARELLIRYGDDEVVRDHLHPRARAMSWSGSYTGRLRKMLEVVRTWLTDENEVIRNWAADIADGIEEEIKKRKPYDDEEDLLYR